MYQKTQHVCPGPLILNFKIKSYLIINNNNKNQFISGKVNSIIEYFLFDLKDIIFIKFSFLARKLFLFYTHKNSVVIKLKIEFMFGKSPKIHHLLLLNLNSMSFNHQINMFFLQSKMLKAFCLLMKQFEVRNFFKNLQIIPCFKGHLLLLLLLLLLQQFVDKGLAYQQSKWMVV